MINLPAVGLAREPALRLLGEGRMEVVGRLFDASNATFLCSVTLDGESRECVYKPVAGERPLWDFPDGTLAAREVAAYQVSEATGWDVVPPTAYRDGPLGPGMCQLWVDVDEAVDLVALVESDHPALRRMAVFDAVVNNADRKGGHLLPTAEGHVYGCDHGVCFSVENKLRTLLWRWRGERLPEEATAVLRRVGEELAAAGAPLRERLECLLSAREVAALRRRVDRLLREARYPQPSDGWPPLPWPPF